VVRAAARRLDGLSCESLGSETGVVATGTLAGAVEVQRCCGSMGPRAVLYSWRAPRSAEYEIRLNARGSGGDSGDDDDSGGGGGLDAFLFALDGDCGGDVRGCDDDDGGNLNSRLVYTLASDEPVTIGASSYDGWDQYGAYELIIQERD